MPLPTFVVVGAQKSGTTTIHDLLAQHDEIWMSDPKELHFFDNHNDRGLDWYSDQFTPRDGERQWGESTPFYMYNDRARTAMLDALPDARFVAVLREPVSRAYSHYWFARSKGREPRESFASAIAAEPQRLADSKDGQPPAFSYLDRGRYLRQLKALESGSSRDRILVLLTDDLQDDPLGAAQSVCRFLDVDDDQVSTFQLRSQNTFAERTINSEDGRRKARLHKRAEGVPVDSYPQIDPEIDAALKRQMREENERLAEWLGRDLNAWLPD
jgi:hypothetical protein